MNANVSVIVNESKSESVSVRVSESKSVRCECECECMCVITNIDLLLQTQIPGKPVASVDKGVPVVSCGPAVCNCSRRF